MTNPIAIIGDIHGEAGKLEALIKKLRDRFGQDIDLYAVGDFIDRGPDSMTVIQICVDENIQGVMGNHETWLFEYVTENALNINFATHPMMGGRATLSSYGVPESYHGATGVKEVLDKKMPNSHRKFIAELPLYLKVVVGDWTVWITHAGIKNRLARKITQNLRFENEDLVEAISQKCSDSILWDHIRESNPEIWPPGPNQIQVFGHTVLPDVVDHGHFVALDTGCGRKRGTRVRPNKLSCVVVHPDGKREIFSSS